MQMGPIKPAAAIFFSLAALIASGCRINRLTNQDNRYAQEGSGSPDGQNTQASGNAALSKDPIRSSCQGLSPYKIVGGQIALDKSQVAAATLKLIIRNQKYCSATLIGMQHIVTAAHCLKGLKIPLISRLAAAWKVIFSIISRSKPSKFIPSITAFSRTIRVI